MDEESVTSHWNRSAKSEKNKGKGKGGKARRKANYKIIAFNCNS